MSALPRISGQWWRWNLQNQFALLGHDLARHYWRDFLMSEAVAAVLGVGFGQMALHHMEATVMIGNTVPAMLLSRAGFERERCCADVPSSEGTSGPPPQHHKTRQVHVPAEAPQETHGQNGNTRHTAARLLTYR